MTRTDQSGSALGQRAREVDGVRGGPDGGVPDGPALLLVDLTTGAVVHADDAAARMSRGLRLPASVAEWSAAAGLPAPDGPEPAAADPLERLARGLGGGGGALEVVALPLERAPALHDHALVALLPPAGRSESVIERAAAATSLSFTVADARIPDMPLVWVNPAFTVTTGYTFEEAVGSNCRSLQGPGTDPAGPAAMRAAVEAGQASVVTVVNYRKDGTPFDNEVSLNPVRDGRGVVTHYVGIQNDVTARVRADAERERALAAERTARREAEQARADLALMVEATSRMAAARDVPEALDDLAGLIVPRLADWVIIATAQEDGAARRRRGAAIGSVVVRHRDGLPEAMAQYARELRQASTPTSILRQLLDGAPPAVVADYDSPAQRAERAGWVRDDRVLDAADDFGARSVLFVPLAGRERAVGAMVFVRGQDSPPYGESDLTVAVDLGRRAGLLVDNARLHQGEHRIAETLQASLLPALPVIEGITAAARYRASARDAAVGGDFYELMALRDGGIGLAIGDVVGHDVLAAAAMGHLRGLVRATAWDGGGRAPDPGEVLTRTDQLLEGLGITTMATVAYASLHPEGPGGGWRIAHSSAGHPPLLLRRPDGCVEVLDGARGLMLGVRPSPRASASLSLAPGTVVLGCTDGLLERRGEDLAVGQQRLVDALACGPDDLEDLCDHLLAACLPPVADDDVAVIAVRV